MRRAFLFLFLTLAGAPVWAALNSGFSLEPVERSQINGWAADDKAQALQAFRASCAKMSGKKAALDALDVQAWRAVCEQARHVSPAQASAFFDSAFAAYRLRRDDGEAGLLTGYYVPLINGSLEKTERFTVPIYRTPNQPGWQDLSRKDIESGALAGKGLEIAWTDDPVMLFFLHIQGSGRMKLPDGRIQTVQFAAKNTREYVPIGRVLVTRGELNQQTVSLQTIRQWLYDHPHEASQIMQVNERYVYFELREADAMPVGAQGVALSAQRSIAIDPAVLPYGLPVFVDVAQAGFSQLMITQDTGSAIKGPLRGDIFFGQGEQAERRAGPFKHAGEWFVLLPVTR